MSHWNWEWEVCDFSELAVVKVVVVIKRLGLIAGMSGGDVNCPLKSAWLLEHEGYRVHVLGAVGNFLLWSHSACEFGSFTEASPL